MLTYAQLVALERSVRNERVLSVYLHGAADDPAARLVWRRELDHSLKDLRRWLAGSSHAERELFERCVGLLGHQLASNRGGLPTPGWAAFITAAGIREASELPVPMPTMAVWSTGMCVSPYMRALKVIRPAIVVLGDARVTRIYRHNASKLERLETIHAHATVEAPSHMGDVPRAGFHTGVRGETGREAVQRAHAIGTERMLKQVVAAALRYAGRDGLVLTGGNAVVSTHVAQAIAERTPDRVLELESLDVHATDAEIAAAARDGASALCDAMDRHRVMELMFGTGAPGLVALGPAATRRALEQARVRDLYLTPRYVEAHTAEAEDAVRQAIDQGATVETLTRGAAEKLDQHGGLGARLRYRMSDGGEPAEGSPELALAGDGGST